MKHRLLLCAPIYALVSAPAFTFVSLPAMAQSTPYSVGSCVNGATQYRTISAAVAAVPAGSTIEICPGTYPEQIDIQKPLTLQGIQSGNSGAVVITVPKGGLKANFTSLLPNACGNACLDSGEAQIAVLNVGGPVNIADIVVDGAGATFSSDGSLIAGLVLDSTSGVIDHVELRNQFIAADHSASPAGYGVLLVDTYKKSPEVSICGSHFYRFSNTGILSDVYLLAADNAIDLRNLGGSIGVFGIDQVGGSASLTGNIITGDGSAEIPSNEFLGVLFEGPAKASRVEKNTIGNANIAIYAGASPKAPTAPLVISHNRLLNNQTAVLIAGNSVESTIEGNSITGFTLGSETSTGISFNCGASTLNLAGNEFSGTTIALAGVPSGASLDSHSIYHNVRQLEQPCP